MWTCQNCGFSDENGDSFEEEYDPESEETVRYCPECGSDEVFLVEEEEGSDADMFEDAWGGGKDLW